MYFVNTANKYLTHHGVKGMKWGVRRYQNKDGSLTMEGKRQRSVRRTQQKVRETKDAVQNIVNSFSKKEQKWFGLINSEDDPRPPTYMFDNEISYVAKRFIKSIANTPIAFLDVNYDDDPGSAYVSVGTMSGSETRGKGYANSLVKKAKDWFETEEAKDVLNLNIVYWAANRENDASMNLAKRSGFVERVDRDSDPTWWVGVYTR